MAFVTAYCLAMILANVFQCRPIHAGWDFFAPGHCASLQEITVGTGALNIISDVAIVVAPLPLVLRLQLRPAKRLGILAILATGILYQTSIPRLIFSSADQLQCRGRGHRT